MHHYGEDLTRSILVDGRFEIQCSNHLTGAVITMSGPVDGILEPGEGAVDESFVADLGRKFAHFLKDNLTSQALAAAGL